MNNKEIAEKEMREWIEYKEREYNQAKAIAPDVISVGEALDKCGVDSNKVYLCYRSTTVALETIEEARELVGKMLKETGIAEFKKIWHVEGKKIVWGYVLDKGDMTLTISPCEPNKDCIPVEKVNTYTTWVCEKA